MIRTEFAAYHASGSEAVSERLEPSGSQRLTPSMRTARLGWSGFPRSNRPPHLVAKSVEQPDSAPSAPLGITNRCTIVDRQPACLRNPETFETCNASTRGAVPVRDEAHTGYSTFAPRIDCSRGNPRSMVPVRLAGAEVTKSNNCE